MPRILHGASIPIENFRAARERLAEVSADLPLAFAAARPADTQDFDFLFPELQNDPANLLPEAQATRDNLILLGQTMRDADPSSAGGDSNIPAGYTYFGQFLDHDITLETVSADLPALLAPGLAPLPLEEIRESIRNIRTATLDLDSVYGFPAPRSGQKMRVGKVSELNGAAKPLLRPPNKGDRNDVMREPRVNNDPAHDRAALIGDPRNDENTIISQLQVAFLRAHNELVERGKSFKEARKILRRHYQHIVLHDFLKRVADPSIVDDTIENGNRVFEPTDESFFMPLEYAVAAYRFGHSMVRADYDFNLNFNKSGEPGTFPATLELLFTFTALSGQLGDEVGAGTDTLPENWIIEWHNFVDVGRPFNKARGIDTKLVEPLFHLRDIRGTEEPGNGARLAVRNLLRGYLLRMPTGQAVARALRQKFSGTRDIPVLTPEQLTQGAASPEQAQVLEDSGFAERTPLWYYILAEAATLGNSQRLGPAGSTILAEVLVGLARHSESSILSVPDWEPNLPSGSPGTFTLADLLKFAKVL
ncbi:MAG TPA: heme peroxidase family protein [Blastocatellia bacterium]|nr:heme peroxidase family protein [Blastocatellia bacterium]